jgi:hypothetical protein
LHGGNRATRRASGANSSSSEANTRRTGRASSGRIEDASHSHSDLSPPMVVATTKRERRRKRRNA